MLLNLLAIMSSHCLIEFSFDDQKEAPDPGASVAQMSAGDDPDHPPTGPHAMASKYTRFNGPVTTKA